VGGAEVRAGGWEVEDQRGGWIGEGGSIIEALMG
jgi:hypothetical protein